MNNPRVPVVFLIVTAVLLPAAGFGSIEVVERRRYADLEHRLGTVMAALFTANRLACDDDQGIRPRPVGGPDGLGSQGFSDAQGSTWAQSTHSWWWHAEMPDPKGQEHKLLLDVSLVQKRAVLLLRKPEIIVGWNTHPHPAFVDLIHKTLQDFEYTSQFDEGRVR